MAKTQQEVIDSLIKNGAASVNINVKNAKVKTFESWSRVRLTTEEEVDAYILQDDNTYQLGKDHVVFISLFSVVNALRDGDYDVVIDHIINNPQSLVVLLKKAKMHLVQQQVKAGDILESNDVPEDHDAIYWHCVSIDFDDAAKERLNRIIDKMLGI